MQYFPIAVKLKDRLVVVVGGGAVAERKAKNLLAAGAKVTVISPEITVSLRQLARNKHLKLINDVMHKKYLAKANIVIAATDSLKINAKISQWAKNNKILVNVVDQPHLSDFISPAVFNKGRLTVAVNTNGTNPKLSRDLKNFLKRSWDGFVSYRRRLSKRSS